MDEQLLNLFDYVEISEPLEDQGKTHYIVTNTNNNEYFKIGESETHLISLIKQRKIDKAVDFSEEKFGQGALNEFIQFLVQQNILSAQEQKNDLSIKEAKFPIPSLGRILNKLQFRREHLIGYHLINIFFILLGIYILVNNTYILNLSSFTVNFKIIIITLLLSFITFSIHEFGHAIRLRIAGKKVINIGFLFTFLLPGFYVDASESYKLKSKYAKVAVAFGGTYAQLAMTGFVLFILIFIGSADSLAIASYYLFINIMTLIGNLIPLSKLDGYWMLASFVGINNLNDKSKNLFKSTLEHLFNNNNEVKFGDIPKSQRILWFFYGFIQFVFSPTIAIIIISNAIYIFNFNTIFTIIVLSAIIIYFTYRIYKFVFENLNINFLQKIFMFILTVGILITFLLIILS